MLESQRPLIAGIAYRLISQDTPGSIYSFSQNKYYSYAGVVNKQAIKVYDDSRKKYITGYCTFPDKYSLYDYATGTYITLDILHFSFSGYDYYSRSYFSGNVNGNYISFYDYKTHKYYNFAGSMIISGNLENTYEEKKPIAKTKLKKLRQPLIFPAKTVELSLPDELPELSIEEKYAEKIEELMTELEEMAEDKIEDIPVEEIEEKSVEEIEKILVKDIELLEKIIDTVKRDKKLIKERKKLLKRKRKEEKKLKKKQKSVIIVPE